jgi:hypothetical protein
MAKGKPAVKPATPPAAETGGDARDTEIAELRELLDHADLAIKQLQGENAVLREQLVPPVKLAMVAATPVLDPLTTRLLATHRAAEKAGDHMTAGALNGVLSSLGEARHKATTALLAIVEKTDGSVLQMADSYSPELRAVLQEIAEL